MFTLQFPTTDIYQWAARYSYPRLETILLNQGPRVRTVGRLTKALLKQVAKWKSPRSAGHVAKNSDAFVAEVSAFAFKTNDERARIEALTLLDGVSWPTASVILHLFHNDPYPIMDFRALWSLGTDVPDQYDFSFWWQYVKACRLLRGKSKADMRTLDRALWQFSKENQPSRSSDAKTRCRPNDRM